MASTFSSSTDARGKGKAFEDTLPQPLLPSASSSSSMVYDVFLNHRGCDVKEGLAKDIYHALNRMGLRVFLDKEVLEYGASIPKDIEDAMSSASQCIAIFSPKYAESSWCLDELSFMFKINTKIIPIFYNVEASDLRWVAEGKGVYASAFSQHQKKRRYTAHKIEEWKTALYNASFLYGHELKRKEDEDRLLKTIVNSMLKEIGPLEVARYPVALDEIVEDFEKSTFKSSDCEQRVNIVGIVGMGGSGKTTLATALYNQECLNIEKHSFISDVRDVAAKNTLHNLQEKLLQDLLSDRFNLRIYNITEGKGILRTRLRSVRVLIFLDDVDHVDQIDALLPGKDIFAAGSLIIVTTRDLNVLQSANISCIYRMKTLDPFHAKQLFCWHAFRHSEPVQEFDDLVEEAMNACQGLPLSLKVLGAQLYKRPKEYWVSQLDKISRILPGDITNCLKISFDALDREEKEMFLDTACFFLGEEKSLAIEVWNGSGWSGLHGWDTLLSKCLVELDQQNCIRMHDHLRDMGREIAIERPPYRLFPSSTVDMWRLVQERVPIRGIMEASFDHSWWQFKTVKPSADYRQLFKAYIELKPSRCGVQILVGAKNEFSEEFATLSKELRWLRLFEFQHSCLPLWLSLENLRVLQLYDPPHLEELWQDNMQQPPLHLRELIIHFVKGKSSFQRFPRSIGRLQHLKKLSCSGGRSLQKLPEEFCNLQSLEHLDLQYMEGLSSLPSRFGGLTNLRHLNLTWCHQLKMLPDSFGDLTNLRHLDLAACCYLKMLPDSFGDLTNLRHLNLVACSYLKMLPDSFGDLTNLRHLNLAGCSGLNMLPESFKQLKHLQYLNLQGCSNLTFTGHNADILENITKLEYLSFRGCHGLQALPHHITKQAFLREVHLKGTSFGELPSSIVQLERLEVLTIGSKKLESLPDSLGNLANLRHLDLANCCHLKMLPDSFKQLKQLQYLHLEGCSNLTFTEHNADIFENITKLEYLSFRGCQGLQALPHHITKQAFLRRVDLEGTSLSELPSSIGQLERLEMLTIGSKKLESLPDSLGNLSCLHFLDIVSEKLESLPDSLGNLSRLTALRISNCEKLESLSDSLGNLSSLTHLEIRGCEKLRFLPESLRRLALLKDVCIHSTGVESLPKAFGYLISLQDLTINDSRIRLLSVPEDFCRSFETLYLSNEGFLEEIRTLPRTVKEINLTLCKRLKDIAGIRSLRNLQRLTIRMCPELAELPSFAEFASIKEIEIEGCQILGRIEGLEQLTSLETLKVHTQWELPGITSLEHAQGLRILELSADKIGALEPCIKTLQKWPGEVIICARALGGVESLVKAFTSSNLIVVETCADGDEVGGRGDSEK